MGINYIKKTLEKMDNDNLLVFLLDIATCGGIDYVEDYNNTKQYVENEKIYYKDNSGLHHIYKCQVPKATIGEIIDGEWLDLLQTFRKPIVNPDDVIVKVDVGEEIVITTTANQNSFELKTPGIEDGMYTVVVFHPVVGRLAASDFKLQGRTVTLNIGLEIPVAGSKIVVDLYRKM